MIMSGRLVCDTYLASKDLIRSKSYRLTDLAQSQLKIVREDIEFDKITKYYENAQSLLYMVKHCSFDAFLSTALMFKLQILPLTKQLTNLAGNLWSRTMTGARAERNEFLLLHEFHRQKYICPDKAQFGKSQAAVIEAIELDQDEGTRYETTKAKKMKLMREKKTRGRTNTDTQIQEFAPETCIHRRSGLGAKEGLLRQICAAARFQQFVSIYYPRIQCMLYNRGTTKANNCR